RSCLRDGQARLHADRGRQRGNHGCCAARCWARAQFCARCPIGQGAASRRTHRGRSQARNTELFFHSQIEFCEGGARVRTAPCWFWTEGQTLKVSHYKENRQKTNCPYGHIGPPTRKNLGNMNTISYEPPAKIRIYFKRSLRFLKNKTKRRGRGGGNPAFL